MRLCERPVGEMQDEMTGAYDEGSTQYWASLSIILGDRPLGLVMLQPLFPNVP